jgi:DNA replication protein DnaC
MTAFKHTLEELSELRWIGFKEALVRQCEDPSYGDMPFTERISHLIHAEITDRKNRSIKRLSSRAKLKYKTAVIEDVEYTPGRNLDKHQIASLAQNHYIEQHQNVIISGATGTGKTYIACALGNLAMAQGYPVYFIRINKLFEEIRLVKGPGSYLKWLRNLLKFKLLILDDFGSSPMKPSDLKELLEIIEDRTQAGSLIMTSQLDVKDWYHYLSEHTLADAVLDRIVHNSYRINLKGESMRKLKNTVFKSDTLT